MRLCFLVPLWPSHLCTLPLKHPYHFLSFLTSENANLVSWGWGSGCANIKSFIFCTSSTNFANVFALTVQWLVLLGDFFCLSSTKPARPMRWKPERPMKRQKWQVMNFERTRPNYRQWSLKLCGAFIIIVALCCTRLSIINFIVGIMFFRMWIKTAGSSSSRSNDQLFADHAQYKIFDMLWSTPILHLLLYILCFIFFLRYSFLCVCFSLFLHSWSESLATPLGAGHLKLIQDANHIPHIRSLLPTM